MMFGGFSFTVFSETASPDRAVDVVWLLLAGKSPYAVTHIQVNRRSVMYRINCFMYAPLFLI